MNSQVWWYVSRSSGIIAWLLVSFSVCWGLFISTKAVAKTTTPAPLLDLHRFLGGCSVVFTGLHLIGLMADSYVYFGWKQLFVPMASDWKTGAVAWGIVAFYLLLTVELTSLMMKRLPRRVWLAIHRVSFVLWAMATYHGLKAGTDRRNDWYRLATLSTVSIVAFLTVVLIMAKRKAAIDAVTTRVRASAAIE